MLTFRKGTLTGINGSQHTVPFRRDGTPRQLRELARRVSDSPFVTLLDSRGMASRKIDQPMENTEDFECAMILQHPVKTVNAFPPVLWCEGNPMLEAVGNPRFGGDLSRLGMKRLAVRKVVAGSGYFVVCFAGNTLRTFGDVPAVHLELFWKPSDVLAAFEPIGLHASLWSDTYLQFWNREVQRNCGSVGKFRYEERPGQRKMDPD